MHWRFVSVFQWFVGDFIYTVRDSASNTVKRACRIRLISSHKPTRKRQCDHIKRTHKKTVIIFWTFIYDIDFNLKKKILPVIVFVVVVSIVPIHALKQHLAVWYDSINFESNTLMPYITLMIYVISNKRDVTNSPGTMYHTFVGLVS